MSRQSWFPFKKKPVYLFVKGQTSLCQHQKPNPPPSLIRDCLYDCWLFSSNTYFLPPGGSVCQGESDACPELLEKTIRKLIIMFVTIYSRVIY